MDAQRIERMVTFVLIAVLCGLLGALLFGLLLVAGTPPEVTPIQGATLDGEPVTLV